MAACLRWPTAIWGRPKWPSRPYRPRLKPSSQSQMADGNPKVPDLKAGVQNAKFIVHYMNFRKFLNFRKFPKYFLSKFFFFKKYLFLTKMIFLTTWIYTSLFGENCQKKFGTAISGHSEFVPVFL